MVAWLKKLFYFPLASYFAFFAKFRLSKWNPNVIVITGSSGKTTLLKLIESQLGDKAYYSHHANSSFGIPFNILGLARQDLTITEWPLLFLKAPFSIFKKLPSQNLYVIEADCDRPREGEFLAKLLKPKVTLWISSDRTHSMYFDHLVSQGKFDTVEDAVAFEYGYFTQHTKDLVIFNADNPRIVKEVEKSASQKEAISKSKLFSKHTVSKDKTEFVIGQASYVFSDPLPEEVFYALAMTLKLMAYLGETVDPSFSKFETPPGRNSRFEGINNITIIDSSYNANLGSMNAMLSLFEKYPSENKWAVIGDMLEQGVGEGREHEKLAEILATMKLRRIILMGPRVTKYTLPKLKELIKGDLPIVSHDGPKQVLEYLQNTISGGEAIFFKGGRLLDGVIEHFLKNKDDALRLCRREKVWQIRREEAGL